MDTQKKKFDKTALPGFNTERERKAFLDAKLKAFLDRITGTPELISVFKRLKDR